MLNTEVIKPLPFAKGFWLIANQSELISQHDSNAGRKKGKGGKVKFIKPRPSQASIDAHLNAIKNGNGLSSHDICELLNLSMSYVTRCLKVLKTEGAIQTSRYNRLKSKGVWFHYLTGDLTEDQQTVSRPMITVLGAIKCNPGLPSYELCKITRLTYFVMKGVLEKLESANKVTKEVWPINKGGHTIYSYTAIKD
jgi:DNA-binding MarR family transcriptional regulator